MIDVCVYIYSYVYIYIHILRWIIVTLYKLLNISESFQIQLDLFHYMNMYIYIQDTSIYLHLLTIFRAPQKITRFPSSQIFDSHGMVEKIHPRPQRLVPPRRPQRPRRASTRRRCAEKSHQGLKGGGFRVVSRVKCCVFFCMVNGCLMMENDG